MSTWYSKHVEENIWRINNIKCITLVFCMINNKDTPVPCEDITFTAHPSHYYVQQQWLFKQRAGIVEKILDTICTQIDIHFNYINKLSPLHLTVIPRSHKQAPHTHLHHANSPICLVTITISPISQHITSHNTFPHKAAIWTYLIFTQYVSVHLCPHIYCLSINCINITV